MITVITKQIASSELAVVPLGLRPSLQQRSRLSKIATLVDDCQHIMNNIHMKICTLLLYLYKLLINRLLY